MFWAAAFTGGCRQPVVEVATSQQFYSVIHARSFIACDPLFVEANRCMCCTQHLNRLARTIVTARGLTMLREGGRLHWASSGWSFIP